MNQPVPRGIGPSEESILCTFEHHSPTAEQVTRIAQNRAAYKEAARVVFGTCRPSADRTAALRQLHESMMTANKAIACEND